MNRIFHIYICGITNGQGLTINNQKISPQGGDTQIKNISATLHFLDVTAYQAACEQGQIDDLSSAWIDMTKIGKKQEINLSLYGLGQSILLKTL